MIRIITVIRIPPSAIPRVVIPTVPAPISPTPRKAGIGIRSPHIIPIPVVGPCRCHPCVIAFDIDIPIVAVQKIDIGIGRIAHTHYKFRIVEPADARCILIIGCRSIESIQVVAFLDRFGNFDIYRVVNYPKQRVGRNRALLLRYARIATVVCIDIEGRSERTGIVGRNSSGIYNLFGCLLRFLLSFLLHDRIFIGRRIIYIIFPNIRLGNYRGEES